jgi:hypothetical protein
MESEQRKLIVKELKDLIQKGNAHITLEEAIAELPANLRGVVPKDLPYSIWQLLEHIRIAQQDIVDFSVSADHQVLDWPRDYWVEPTEQVTDEMWQNCLDQIKKDQKRFLDLLDDESNDLTKAFPWGNGQNLLREAILIGDHNAYHTAEILVIRRLFKAWD